MEIDRREEPWRLFATRSPGHDPGITITERALEVEAPPGAVPPAAALPALLALPIAEDGEFALGPVLGQGGMGQVLLARQRSLSRDVALKALRADRVSPRLVAALLAEATVTGALEHPNVVPVHALGLDASGRPVLVMKRIEGVSLRDLARDPAHPMWATIAHDGDRLDAEIEILMAVCNALHFAHSRGVVHRDVKPENVMIGAFGETYLVDWGVALHKAPGGPPRVALLTGRPRHEGDGVHAVLLAAAKSRPFEYDATVPAELAAICNRATSADPRGRFASALELRRALAAFRRHRGSIALSDEAAERMNELRRVGAGRGGDRRVHALMTECRFGFTQALRSWPENGPARVGLAECLELMIEHEIVQRDLEGARALYAELGEPRDRLAARIDALAAELGAAATREARLRALERERDLATGGGAQLAALSTLPALAVGMVVYLLQRDRSGLTPAELLVPPAAGLLGLLAALRVVRHRLGASIGGKALAAFTLVPALCVAHRVLGLYTGEPFASILMTDLLIAGAVCGALGFVVARRIAWAAVPAGIGAVGIAARPHLALPLFAAATVSAFFILLWMWRSSMQSRTEPASR